MRYLGKYTRKEEKSVYGQADSERSADNRFLILTYTQGYAG